MGHFSDIWTFASQVFPGRQSAQQWHWGSTRVHRNSSPLLLSSGWGPAAVKITDTAVRQLCDITFISFSLKNTEIEGKYKIQYQNVALGGR